MLPGKEIEVLALTVTAALAAAQDGRAGDGYALLLAGLSRARASTTRDDAWSEQLVEFWETAAEGYCEQYFRIGG